MKQPVAQVTTTPSTGRRTTWARTMSLFAVMAVVAVAVTMLAFSFSSFGAYLGDAEVAVVATGNSIRRRLGEVASSAELKLAFKVTSKSKNDDLTNNSRHHATNTSTLPRR